MTIMAKAKKTESAASTEKKPAATKKAPAAEKKTTAAKAGDEKKPATKAAGAKKTAATKAAAPAQPAGVPLIDTNLAAQSAAKMLLNRAVAGDAPTAAAQPGKESSTFKNLKDQLAKPKPAGLSHILGPTVDAKKSASNFLNQQRGGHNQTQGGFNKTGVPRRTNG